MNNWSMYDSQYQVPDTSGSYYLFDASPSTWNVDWGGAFSWAGNQLWNAATSQVGINAIGAGISGYMQGEAIKDKSKSELELYREKMQMERELAMAQIASQENMLQMKIDAEERRRKQHNDSFAQPISVSKSFSFAKKPGILG